MQDCINQCRLRKSNTWWSCKKQLSPNSTWKCEQIVLILALSYTSWKSWGTVSGLLMHKFCQCYFISNIPFFSLSQKKNTSAQKNMSCLLLNIIQRSIKLAVSRKINNLFWLVKIVYQIQYSENGLLIHLHVWILHIAHLTWLSAASITVRNVCKLHVLSYEWNPCDLASNLTTYHTEVVQRHYKLVQTRVYN